MTSKRNLLNLNSNTKLYGHKGDNTKVGSNVEIETDPKALLPLKPSKKKPTSKSQLIYDCIMLAVIVIDLLIIGTDLILVSGFATEVSAWLGVSDYLIAYKEYVHPSLRVVGGFFTLFLIAELLVRWIFAIINKDYLRWFFFPFIHWYEVLGCFPQLRALRLLRAIFIGRKLYAMGYQVLPKKWIDSGKFYYALVLEELSDRVILTATGNIRDQITNKDTSQRLIEDIFNKSRPAITATLTSMLQQELVPKVQRLAQSSEAQELATLVGISVQEALVNTPELRRYMRLIPIAGKLIEEELHIIGQHIGENLTLELTERLTQTSVIDAIIADIAESIAHIDFNNSELHSLVTDIINDSLSAFEEQVKIQQWTHHEYLQLD